MRNTVRDKGKSVAEDIPIKATAEKCKEVESSKFEFQSQGSRISDNHGIRKGVVADSHVDKGVGREIGPKLTQHNNVNCGIGSEIGPEYGVIWYGRGCGG
ncbi:hypothetical protein QYF36_011411 [Acer negundo]|nr:hypothetical protein QYF36_011411 [Acer negundo]